MDTIKLKKMTMDGTLKDGIEIPLSFLRPAVEAGDNFLPESAVNIAIPCKDGAVLTLATQREGERMRKKTVIAITENSMSVAPKSVQAFFNETKDTARYTINEAVRTIEEADQASKQMIMTALNAEASSRLQGSRATEEDLKEEGQALYERAGAPSWQAITVFANEHKCASNNYILALRVALDHSLAANQLLVERLEDLAGELSRSQEDLENEIGHGPVRKRAAVKRKSPSKKAKKPAKKIQVKGRKKT